MKLLDRAGELQSLQAALEDARGGRGRTAFVCGEAGIGKTSLIRAFLAGVSDVSVLVGQCDNLIAPRVFGPFRDMARMSAQLPSDLESNPDRELLLSGLLDVVGSSLRNSIVIIEDAHWIDDASLDILRYLVRRMSELPALLIVSFRDDELSLDHPLRTLAMSPSDRPPVRLELDPLSRESVAALAAGTRHDPDHLIAISGGNPFYLGEVLGASPDGLPASIRDSVTSRAARVSSGGRLALQVLSVIPAGADPALARALSTDDQLDLDAAEQSGLLAASANRIGFRHELARRAVEESLSFGERLACNQMVLEALVATNAEPTTLIHVARAAGDAARATGFALAVLRDGVAPTSHREIWTLSRIALEHTSELDRGEIAELQVRAARAGHASNRHSEAREHAREAVRILREGGKTPELAEALMTVATLSGALGEHSQALPALNEAREILEAEPVGEDLARCYGQLSSIAMVSGDYEDASHWSELAIDLGEQHKWYEPVVQGLGNRGVARTCVGDEGGYDDLARARELGAIHGPIARHVVNVHNSAVTFLRWARPREAAPLIEEAERLAIDHGLDNMVFHARTQRAITLMFRGEIDAAETLLAELLNSEGSDPGAIRTSAHALLARIYARRGDPRAGEAVEAAWQASTATGEHQKIAVAGITKLEYAWLQRDHEGLRSLAVQLLEIADRNCHLRLRAEALRYLMRIGEPVGRCDDCPESYRAALTGDFGRAAKIWEQAGQPYEHALELIESTDTSVAFEGLRILDRLGATRTADLARMQLRSRGLQSVPRGPRKESDGSVAVLTERQVEVVQLIADGLTNSEIAEELFVARRTVDNHVSAILTRLGVESRHEAVDQAVAKGLVPTS